MTENEKPNLCYINTNYVYCKNRFLITVQGSHLILLCNRSWHLPGNPKLVGTILVFIKEGLYVDLSMDTLHLKYPLVLFGYEGSALTLPLFLHLYRITMRCHCSSTITNDHVLIIFYGTK